MRCRELMRSWIMGRLALTTAGLAAAALVLPGGTVQAQPADSVDAEDTAYVWLVAEPDSVVPSLPLMTVETTGPVTVEFTVRDGAARFVGGLTQVTTVLTQTGQLNTPPIVAGVVGDDSRITVTAADTGQAIAPELNLTSGSPAALLALLPAGHAAYIAAGETFTVLDPALISPDARQTDLGLPAGSMSASLACAGPSVSSLTGEAQAKARGHAGLPDGLLWNNQGPPFGWEDKGGCLKAPSLSGQIKWEIDNPPDSKYRVKREKGHTLARPSKQRGATEKGIDGLYNCGEWGCWAIKIPGHCRLTVRGESLTCCCNAAVAVFKGVCRWVNTRVEVPGYEKVGDDWPDCANCG